MDKIERSILNQNFRTSDVHYMQSSYTDAIKGICSPYSDEDTYILTGCEITDNSAYFSVTEGFIVINGEVCKVDSHTCPNSSSLSGGAPKWIVEVNKPVDGIRNIQSGGNSSTWVNRRGKLVIGLLESPVGGSRPGGETIFDPLSIFRIPETPTIHELIANKTQAELALKVTKITLDGSDLSNGWTGRIVLERDPFGFVHGFAELDGTSATSNEIVNPVPAGWVGYVAASRSDAKATFYNSSLGFTSLKGFIFTTSFSYKATA